MKPSTRRITRRITSPRSRRMSGWLPESSQGLFQRMDSFAYAASPIGGLPVVESLIGTAAVPRGQRCVLFDNINDYATNSNLPVGPSVTACGWIKPTAASQDSIFSFNSDSAGSGCLFRFLDQTTLQWFPNLATTVINIAVPNLIGTWIHVAIVQSGTTYAVYWNGQLIQTATTVPMQVAGNRFTLGAYDTNLIFNGSMYDARIYSIAKSASEIQAIFNQHLTPATIDRTGLLAGWWLNEESGTTHYDWSGNGRNLTATNVTQSTYHATDAGVRYNAANELGYTLSGSVVIPRNEAVPTQDSAGGSLQFSGPIKLNATMEVPCITLSAASGEVLSSSLMFGGSGDFCMTAWVRVDNAADENPILATYGIGPQATGFEFYIFQSRLRFFNGTGPTTVNGLTTVASGTWVHVAAVRESGVLRLYINSAFDTQSSSPGAMRSDIVRVGSGYGAVPTLGGRLSDVRIFNVAKSLSQVQAIQNGAFDSVGLLAQWPIQAGSGSSNTNRTIHDVSGNGNHLTVTNGTVANQWANRTNVVRDWCLDNGGSLAANGAFVPGRIGSSLDAAGNAKQFQPGSHENPFSRYRPNSWSAPSLVNIGCTASDLYSPSQMASIQAESVADTRYASKRKYLAYRTPLVDPNRSSAAAWVQQ